MSNPTMEIRPAMPGDTSTILTFIRELADFEKLGHEVTADVALLQENLFANNSPARVVIGEVNGQAAAFALFFYNFSTFLGQKGIYLEDLYVRPQYRNNGFGEQLLRHLAALAVAEGCGRLEWSVLDWNTHAIRFYERLGAQAMDEWTVHRVTGAALIKLAES